jgi:hypothetical protein
MIVSDAAFPAWKVAHRGSAAAEVLDAAMNLVGRFKEVGMIVERMRNTYLTESQRLAFASDALRLRYQMNRRARLSLLWTCSELDGRRMRATMYGEP